MANQQDNLVEFYRQLSLLVRAELPLPESLANLAESTQDQRMKAVLRDITREAGQGRSFSAALERHPRFFPRVHLRIIKAGEESGALSDVLAEVAEIARFEQSLVEKVRDSSGYPLFVTVFAAGVFLVMLRFVVRDFGVIYRGLVEDVAVPLLCRSVFALGELVVQLWPVLVVLFAGSLLVLVWLFGNSQRAGRLFRRVARSLPGADALVRDLDAARCCAVWSALIRQQTPMVDAFEATAEMIETPELANALRQLARQCAAGTRLQDALDLDDVLPDSLRLALIHTPEGELAEEVGGLKEVYVGRAEQALNRAGAIWEIAAFLGMAAFVGAVIISLFVPLIKLNFQLIGI